MPGEVAPAGAEGEQAGQRRGPLSGVLGAVLRMGVMWYIMNLMKGKNATPPAKGTPGASSVLMSYPVLAKGDLVDFFCFISERAAYVPADFDMADLIWSETAVRLALPDSRNYTYVYEPSQAVQNNGSVYLHVVLARAGSPILPSEPLYTSSNVFISTKQLNVYMPKPKNSTGVNLLTDTPLEPQPKDKNATREVISLIRPNVTIALVDHFQAYPRKSMPQQISSVLTFDPEGNYEPVVWFNDFWLLRDKLVPLNASTTAVTLHLTLEHASMWYWQLLLQMDQSFGLQVSMGLSQDGESDELKRVLLEGNPYLLALTFCVSLLHTVFDMLAFKNDIGFWKNNKSMEGLSARSVVINAFCQVVILLYLLDSETSFVVLLSSFLGTGIELWKVTKAFKVSTKPTFPFINLEDRASYNSTKKHDEDATRYLSYALYPLVLGYSVYTLMYKTHKSWYSWVLSTLVGAVYMFGFILMCPQLYLNYKLKSVAHLPWRQMTYKFLNTIIDDLFAFVIKMPLLHRLSVFRDDLVFLIYLYQRWIYRVDRTRVNEFGWSEAQPDDATAQADGAAPAVEGTEQPKAIEGTAADGSADAGGAVQRKGKGKKGAAADGAATNGEAVAAATAAAADGSKKDK